MSCMFGYCGKRLKELETILDELPPKQPDPEMKVHFVIQNVKLKEIPKIMEYIKKLREG